MVEESENGARKSWSRACLASATVGDGFDRWWDLTFKVRQGTVFVGLGCVFGLLLAIVVSVGVDEGERF